MTTLYRRKPAIVSAKQMTTEGILTTISGIFTYAPGDWLLSSRDKQWIVENDIFPILYEPLPDLQPRPFYQMEHVGTAVIQE